MVLGACAVGSARTTTRDRLEALDGEPCVDLTFTCVTLKVPLDRDAAELAGTTQIQFAVLPAQGMSRGVFVDVVGGPGESGLEEAWWRVDDFPEEILDNFDVVFFDQRWVGTLDDLDCPETYDAFQESWSDDVGWETEVRTGEQFFSDCFAEIGNPEILRYLSTDYAIDDLEAFRQTMGYDELILYGESYGTSFAQAYATKYPDSVDRLILDGPVDRSRDGIEAMFDQAEGALTTLDYAFGACDQDPGCSSDMGIPAASAYDALRSRLESRPETVSFPTDPDVWEDLTLSASDLDSIAVLNSYSETDRMLLLRALAAATARNDLRPLLHLDQAGEDDDTSDLAFYSVSCLDMSLPGSTVDEEIKNLTEARRTADERIQWEFSQTLTCAVWPHADRNKTPTPPFLGEGIPTLVIASQADPATPYRNGAAIADQADLGYLLTVQGGFHVMFGSGYECVDETVVGFLFGSNPPRHTTCDAAVILPYQPLAPVDLADLGPEQQLPAILKEVWTLPEVMFGDGEVACDGGGRITLSDGGSFSLHDCGLFDGLRIRAIGQFYYDRETATLSVTSITGDDCGYRYQIYWPTGDQSVEQHCEWSQPSR